MRAGRTQRLRAGAIGLACTTVLGLVGVTAPTASAAAATITVTVVDSASGAPVGPSCAYAYPFDPRTGTGSDVRYVCSLTNVITFDTLVTGTQYYFYVLEGYPGDHLAATLTNPGQGTTPAYFTAPAQVTAALVKGVRVGGQVTDGSGNPLDGSVTGTPTTSTSGVPTLYASLTQGRWQTLVAPGSYRIEFQTTPGIWQESYAFGKRTPASADVIDLSGPGPVTVDQVVPTPSGFSGTITEAGTGKPVAGACLEVLNPAAPDFLLGYACADATGHYVTRADVPSGTWLVRTYDETGAHAAVSRSVQATSGQLLTGVDFQLPVAATLTGRVVDRRTGAPVAGACPSAALGHTQESPFLQQTSCSDASGNWTLTGLPAGQLSVYLSGNADHIGRWANDAETQATAKLFTATSGATTSTGTVREFRGATLTGRVTDRNGRPVAGAFVSVGVATTFRAGSGPDSGPGVTDARGRYTITNIDPQRSVVEVQTPDTSGLAWQWSGRATDPAKGKGLTFRYEGRVEYDFALRPEAVLSVSAGPTISGNVSVDVQTLSGAGVGYHTEVSPSYPSVTIHGLPASDVVVQLSGDGSTFYWYGGTSLATATRVSLRASRTTSIVVPGP